MWGSRALLFESHLRKNTNVTVTGAAAVRPFENKGRPAMTLTCRVSEIALHNHG
ncbi:MAG: hypothetical protein HQL37_09260 [Alphaproteobacteria bacterium]|nr:hypothetical protein [Alphaproteobacteria bacterium]